MSRIRLPKVVAKATEWAGDELIGPGNAGACVCVWAAIEHNTVASKMAVKWLTLNMVRPLAVECRQAGGGVGSRGRKQAALAAEGEYILLELGASSVSWEQEQPPGARINTRAVHPNWYETHALVVGIHDWSFPSRTMSCSWGARCSFGWWLHRRCKCRATLAQSLDESQAAFNVQSPKKSNFAKLSTRWIYKYIYIHIQLLIYTNSARLRI